MRADQMSNGDVRVIMNETEAINLHRDLVDGNVSTPVMERLMEEIESIVEPEEEDDWEEDDDDDDDEEDTGDPLDDSEEISS